MVIGGMALYPAAQAPTLLRLYRDLTANAPDELMTLFAFLSAPPAPFVPPEVQGAPMCAIAICYAGPIQAGRHWVDAIRAFGPAAVDLFGPMPYTALQQSFDAGNPFGLQVYVKSDHLAGLGDDVIDTLVANAAGQTSPLSTVLLFPLGGAVGRVGEQETAFSRRDTAYDYVIYSLWPDPADADRHIQWTRTFATAMRPFAVGVYVNELGSEGEERIRAAYSPANYDRLATLKQKYDPSNFFRMNQNIKPLA
ncbi:MAG: hypothetical protein NVSMB42_04090 [Herpetosiphon sp.]